MSDDKKKLDEAATLSISTPMGTDGSNNYEWSADNLDDLATILRLSGINETTKVTSATVTTDVFNPETKVSFKGTSSSSDMAAIMAIINPPVMQTDAVGECPCDAPVAEQAEHDYGSNPTSRKGHEYNVAPHDFQGRAGMPNRLVNNYGDNAMDNSDVTEQAAPKKLADYLREAEIAAEARTPKFIATIEQIQHGGWGMTTLKTKDLTVTASDEDAAKQAVYNKLAKMPRQRLANGDTKSWQFVHIKPVQTESALDEAPKDAVETARKMLKALPPAKDEHEAAYRNANPAHAMRGAGWEFDDQTGEWYNATPSPEKAREMHRFLPPAKNDHEKAYRNANPVHALKSAGWDYDERNAKWISPEEKPKNESELEEAPNYNRYGEPLFLLPTHDNNTLDELEHNEYFGDMLSAGKSSIVVVGKANKSSGQFTPRYCSTAGEADYKIGQEVTIVHDQTGGLTQGKVLYQFSGKDYMDPQGREKIAADLAKIGISRTKKVPVKVFK